MRKCKCVPKRKMKQSHEYLQLRTKFIGGNVNKLWRRLIRQTRKIRNKSLKRFNNILDAIIISSSHFIGKTQ